MILIIIYQILRKKLLLMFYHIFYLRSRCAALSLFYVESSKPYARSLLRTSSQLSKRKYPKVITEIPKENYENIFKSAYERPEKYVPKNKKEL